MNKHSTRTLLSAAAVLGAGLFVLPAVSVGYSLIGGNLGIGTFGNGYQRDFRIWNNAADSVANNNNTPDAAYPGALGAEMAIWKAGFAWNSSNSFGGKNFDFDWQGETSSMPGNSNTVSWGTAGCGGGTLAYTVTPISDGWTILMCEGWTWSDGPGNPGFNQIDIQGVAAHELGHALGLGHSNVSCGSCSAAATMCSFICANGVSERDLTTDDKNGLQAIYGAKPGNKPLITGLGGSTQIGGTLVINGSNFPTPCNVKFTAGTTQNTGGIPGTVFNVNPVNSTQIQVTIPNGALDGNVLVWSPGTNLLSNGFPIDVGGQATPPPVINSVSPGSVAALGGTPMTISGQNFTGATQVGVGLVVLGAGQFTVVNSTTITFNAPTAILLGATNVSVTTPVGPSNLGSFTYVLTDPLALQGQGFLVNGQNATYSWGGQINQLSFLVINTTGVTVPFAGGQLLNPQIFVQMLNTNFVGVGTITFPVNGAPTGIFVHAQILTADPSNPVESTVKLSNIVASLTTN